MGLMKKELELDTGFTLRDWKKKSEEGEACGILGCLGIPAEKCEHCGNWYCSEHTWVMDITVAHGKK